MNCMEREALLYDALPDARVDCHVCQWRCRIGPGRSGVCRVRVNRNGVLHTTNYGEVSSIAVDPIEKKPLFHFYPGSRVLSLGSFGCNFHCVHCQNWEIACTEVPQESHYLSAEDQVALALERHCDGVAWTYNEPTIWFEYTLDSARLAREKGLYTVYVTNGFMTAEALDAIGPWLMAYRVDVKGFADSAYMRIARVKEWRGILDVAARARHKWNMHVEVVTNIIPTVNDDDDQLQGIAEWMVQELGPLTPWHVTRFFPMHQLRDVPMTPSTTIERAVRIGREAGLRFVYSGNVPGDGNEDTVCTCGETAVRRVGYSVDAAGLEGARCAHCGADLNMRR
jgi:pyruvate formate lyase activating enzyme